MIPLEETTCSTARRVAIFTLCAVAGAAIGAAIGIGMAAAVCRRIEQRR